jgi:YihY family inner membrane protein
MQSIFFHRQPTKKRHPIVSAIIPYLFICALGFGLLVVTAIASALDMLSRDTIAAIGHAESLARLPGYVLHLIGIAGLALLLTALYLVLPVGRMALRHALIGGITATLLWEVLRFALVWYFAHLSMVSVIYGSFATTIVLLLTMEVGSIIVLLGAQVIAELERSQAGALAPVPQAAQV